MFASSSRERHAWSMPTARLTPVVGSAVSVALVTAAVFGLRTAVPVLSLGVLYLFAVLPVALLWGRAWGVVVAVASMLAFNWFFLPPRHTFQLADRANWLALAVYVVTALVVSDRAAQARRRAAEAEQREREETLLAEMSLALLQGEHVIEQLDRLGEALAGVLNVRSARITLGEARPDPHEVAVPLVAGERRVGMLFLHQDVQGDEAVRRRFLPALASLLAIALDRAQLEQEALAAERLRVSDSLKTTILRAVSHDLRSPLTAMRVAAESLVSPAIDLDEADRRHQLDTVRTEARRLDRLVANLLDLSRLESGAAAPRRELVAADDLVAQALGELPAPEQTRVVVGLPEDVPLLEVDAVQVERALVNLLENALRYSLPGSDVEISVRAASDEVVLCIRDDGPGMDAGDLARVFEPFERLAPGEARQGAGLGLAIARGFAEVNGGRIWAESRSGEGASFMLAFPRSATVVGGQV